MKAYYQSPLGWAYIEANEQGILSVSVKDISPSEPADEHPLLAQCLRELEEYFAGQRTDFEVALAPKGTDFQQLVWQELLKIPFGKTLSYLQLARLLGDEKTIRAAAAANGKNPLWIIVPCHRVIGSDGSLTGYAGGLWRKKWLLEHEQKIKTGSTWTLF
ncbi:MAG: methylated-DNA--[protein]-cysteine S-methyltransferase [Spirosomataceae bacterium]